MAITSGSGNVIEVMLQLKDEMSGRLDKAAGSLGSVASKMALVGGAALTAGAVIGNFVARMAEQVEQLDNLSASTGVSTRNLQVLQFAFRQGGVDAAALSQGMNFLNRAIANNDPALAKLGITSRDTFSAFMQAAEGIRNTTDSTERARLVFEVFGRGGAQLIPILNQVAGNLDGVTQAATATGNAMSEHQLKVMREVDAAMDSLAATAEGLKNQFVVGLAPAVLLVLDPLNKLLGVMRQINTAASNVGKGFGNWMADRMGLRGRGGGGDFELPPGWGEVGPGGRGTTEYGPGNNDGMNTLRAAQAEAAKRARQQAQIYDMGMLGMMSQGDQMGLRGGMGAPNQMLQIGPMVDESKEHLTSFAEHMEKVSGTIIQSFATIGDAMHSGIVDVMMNLTNRAQTFRTAIVNIFNAVRDGVLRALAEIVASAITQAFIKLLGIALSALTGNPFFAVVGGASPGGGTFGAPGGPTMAPPMPGVTVGMPDGGAMSMAGGPAGRGGDTYNIYMSPIEAKGALQAIISPTGSFRGANTRLAEMAAVS